MPSETNETIETTEDYERLFETGEGYDVVIYAGQNENVKEIRAHSSILCSRSQYFRTAFSKEWAEKKDGKFIFKKPDVSPLLFEIIIKYFYCEKIDLTALKDHDVLNLLLMVDELDVQTLITRIKEYLIQQNPMGTFEAVYQFEPFTELCNDCLEKICQEPELVFCSDKFLKLKASIMELLLKQDLELDEIIIWDSLIKWGLAQVPTISHDVAKWNEEDFTIMERVLNRFIPLIRYLHITPENFLDKIYPFKRFLPDDLLKKILTFHMIPKRTLYVDLLPPRKKYGSVIIKPQHFFLFSKWIYLRSNSLRNIPYNFELLYRASRDGKQTRFFHNKCDGMGATIFVAKIKDSNHVIGGFNPLDWYEEGYRYTSKSFIFSFKDCRDIKTVRIGRIMNGCEKHAVYCDIMFGPSFGYRGDISSCDDELWSSCKDSYGIIDIPTKFDIDEYEVFQVIEV